MVQVLVPILDESEPKGDYVDPSVVGAPLDGRCGSRD